MVAPLDEGRLGAILARDVELDAPEAEPAEPFREQLARAPQREPVELAEAPVDPYLRQAERVVVSPKVIRLSGLGTCSPTERNASSAP